jgi:hypothetical protein
MKTGLRISHSNTSRTSPIQARVDKIAKFIGDYIYYRKRRHSHSVALRMVRNTL